MQPFLFRTPALSAACFWLLVGCASEVPSADDGLIPGDDASGPVDGQVDGGVEPDSAAPADAGDEAPDAAVEDASPAPDSGRDTTDPEDSGTVPDAAPGDDAILPDVIADASNDAVVDTDAGISPDGGIDTWVDPEPAPFVPAPSTLHRLSAQHVRNTLRDLLGVEYAGPLEQDTSLHGFVSVAGSSLTLTPLAVEQMEEAAWVVATGIVDDPARRLALVGCDIELDGEPCLRNWLTRFLRRAWRRPPTEPEVEGAVSLAVNIGTDLREPWQGVRAAIAFALQSPHFVFRVELAEPAADRPGWRRYTDFEMASRLSYALWGSMPDDALLDAADRGELTRLDTLNTHVERLLTDPRADDRLVGFFEEFIGLQRLAGVNKDPILFPQMTDGLRASMRREIAMLFEELALRGSGDFRRLFTTNLTYVDRELAAIYGLPFSGSGVQQAVLPDSQRRGGLLGRAAVLALFSHATVNSPTFRGKFVRMNLLCQDIPPPPPGVAISIPEPDEARPMTLRERLGAHLSSPSCASCHTAMDPLGFPLEHFNPLGMWQDTDNGLPIDPSGDVDGVPVSGADELGAAVAGHPRFGFCITTRLYRYATGQLEGRNEVPLLESLSDVFGAESFSFPSLVRALVASDGFRYASAPLGERCDDLWGDTRACATACGAGTEVCGDEGWTGCSAPAPAVEVCNGVDDDCDGDIDEDLIRVCGDAVCGAGVSVCDGGVWSTCEGRAPRTEVCNSADDDCDGATDEDISVAPEWVSYLELGAAHELCDGFQERIGSACNAAVHRSCASRSCAATGFGPVEGGAADMQLVCVPDERVQVREVSWAQLIAQHPPCNGSSEFFGPNCNAAIHRWCGSQGLRTGWGPVERDATRAYVACAPDAVTVSTTYTVLSTHHGTCSRNGERIGPACNAAIHRFCRSQGYASGWGPVENFEDIAAVSCIPER